MKALKELRKEKNILQKDVAKELNIKNTTYSNWEVGVSEPDIQSLKKLADFFGVSIDYLVGRESEDGLIVSEGQSLSGDEKELLDGFRRLNAAGKGRILGNLEGLLQASALFTDKTAK